MRHDPNLQQWFTPEWLAKRIVAEFGPWEGLHVLEPTAGDGAFVLPLLEAGAKVTAFEIDRDWARVLDDRVRQLQALRAARLPSFTLHARDFLEAQVPREPLDRVVMNPPYDDGLDADFLERALEWAPEVIAHVKLSALAGRGKWDRIWCRARLTDLVVLPRRPRYSGTSTSGRHDMAVLRYRRGRPMGGCDLRYWIEPEGVE